MKWTDAPRRLPGAKPRETLDKSLEKKAKETSCCGGDGQGKKTGCG